MAISPNMLLDLPTPGITSGSVAASMNVTAFETVDSHTHVEGSGVPVPTAGLNINADLGYNGFFIQDVSGVRCASLAATPTTDEDVNIIYVKNGELAYRDASGNEVVITSAGAIAGVPGSISGLTSPASGSYSGVTKTLSFFQDTNLPAKLVISDIKLYEFDNASANPITIAAPAGVGAAYTWTLPVAPAVGSVELVTVNSSGQMDTAPLTGTAAQITVTQSLSGVALSLPSAVTMPGSLTTTSTLSVGTILTVPVGSAATPSVVFAGDANTGFYWDSSDVVGCSAGGSRRLYVATNRVGADVPIWGASSSTAAAPAFALTDGTNSGMYRAAANSIGISGGGSNIATFSSSGINILSGGVFKVTTYSGSVSAGGQSSVLNPGGTILGLSGYFNSGSGSAFGAIGPQDVADGETLVDFLGVSASTFRVRERGGSVDCTYRVIAFHL